MNQKGFSAILVLVIAIILAAGVGGYWYVSKNKPAQKPADETANIKTYHNDTLGFEIKYDSNALYDKASTGTFNAGIDYGGSLYGVARNEKVGYSGIKLYSRDFVSRYAAPDTKICNNPESGKEVPCLSLASFSIEISRLNKKYEDAIVVAQASGFESKEAIFAGVKGLGLMGGLEGENTNVYLLPLKSGLTLLIVWKNDKNGANGGLLPFTEQQKLFNDVVSTLKIL